MITRSAIFEGVIRPGKEDEFYRFVERQLLPLWRRLPNGLDVRVWRPTSKDEGAPNVVLVQQIDYDNHAAIDEALASPVRQEAVAATKKLYELFDGRHYHFIYERVPSG